MIHDVHVHLLPNLFEPEEFRGGVAVILDILRASTTIVHVLAHGAARVIPTGEIAEARRVAGGLPVGSVLLGGEREGLQIEGFDLDNSPFAYTPELVKGRTIVFTTTNGTRALLRSDRADRVLIGSFVNLQAVVDDLAQEDRPVHLVCAGTKGKVTLEDTLCAGAIVGRLLERCGLPDAAWDDDQLQLALDHYRRRVARPDGLLQALCRGTAAGTAGGWVLTTRSNGLPSAISSASFPCTMRRPARFTDSRRFSCNIRSCEPVDRLAGLI